MTDLRQIITALTGWRRLAVAALMGVFSAGLFPPVGAVPLLLLYGGLYWLARSAGSARQLGATGWWFFFGQFGAGLYWIANALLVPPAEFLWLLPFAWVALPAALALFPVVCLLIWRRLDGQSAIGFILALLAGEVARGTLLTGFPWNLTGAAFERVLPLQQGASVGGVYLLSLLGLVLGVLPACLTRRALMIWALVLTGALGWGSWRLAAHPPSPSEAVVRLVQPNIPQHLKWDRSLTRQNFEDQIALSRLPSERPLAAVIWSETATGFAVEQSEPARALLAGAAPPGGSLITGTLRIIGQGDRPTVTNGMIALDGEASLRGAFDKFHLVPFGEYVPLRGAIPLPAVAADGLDFTPGPGPRTLRLPGLPPVAPLICYEVIFPGAVTDREDHPAWLLNLTNDAWYGVSTGPYQHYHISALRAVEEGVPLARVANTGISGMVDPLGRTVARLGLNERGLLDVALPHALENRTIFSQYGWFPLLGAAGILALIGWVWRRNL